MVQASYGDCLEQVCCSRNDEKGWFTDIIRDGSHRPCGIIGSEVKGSKSNEV